jgi:peptide/nickel transport system permease protein
MDTIKYIVKRLMMALLILFGVSIIIYALARLMPTDFVDQQYSSALSQGTMQQEDVDRIKELYGLSMPDSYLTITVGSDGKSEYKGVSFQRNVKYDDYDTKVLSNEKDGTVAVESRYEWYQGSYDAKGCRLYINEDGTYDIYNVTSNGVVTEETSESVDASASDSADNVVITLDEVLTWIEGGTYSVNEAGNILLTLEGESSAIEATVSFRQASFWTKAGAIFSGYFTWLGNLLQGDLGISFKYKKPVGDVIKQNMGVSFAISFIATILQFAIAIPLGIQAATHQYGVVDYTVTILAMIGISLPTFFLAALVIRLFAVKLGWFEVGGLVSGSLAVDASWIVRIGDILWHMVLPMTVLVILSIGSLMRYTRTNTLEVLNADYIRTARAKGLSEKTVIYRHAFRNTMIPLVTMMAGILPSLFGGAMITETVFSIPGIGKLAYDALVVSDVTFIMGYNMFLAVMTVLGTLLSDLMYAVVDPRVKLGK